MKKTRSRRRGGAGVSATAPGPSAPRQPGIRPFFYSERQPTREGAYEIRAFLETTASGPQRLIGRVYTPSGAVFIGAERSAPPLSAPLQSATAKTRNVSLPANAFGPPEGVDGALLQELLTECRIRIHSRAARGKSSS